MDNAFDLIAARSQQNPFVLTPEEYQAVCEAVCALPPDEQAAWDDVILNFVYDGKHFTVAVPEPAPQGVGG